MIRSLTRDSVESESQLSFRFKDIVTCGVRNAQKQARRSTGDHDGAPPSMIDFPTPETVEEVSSACKQSSYRHLKLLSIQSSVETFRNENWTFSGPIIEGANLVYEGASVFSAEADDEGSENVEVGRSMSPGSELATVVRTKEAPDT